VKFLELIRSGIMKRAGLNGAVVMLGSYRSPVFTSRLPRCPPRTPTRIAMMAGVLHNQLIR